MNKIEPAARRRRKPSRNESDKQRHAAWMPNDGTVAFTNRTAFSLVHSACGQPHASGISLQLAALLILVMVASLVVAAGNATPIDNAAQRALSGILPSNVALRTVRAEALNEVGVERLKAGEYQAAARSFRDAIELDPNLIVVYNNLGTALMCAGDLQGARTTFTAVLKIQPRNEYARHQMETLPVR